MAESQRGQRISGAGFAQGGDVEASPSKGRQEGWLLTSQKVP
jgi:hypothetical protein